MSHTTVLTEADMIRFLSKRFGTPTTTRKRPGAPARRTTLSVEALEDRRVLSGFNAAAQLSLVNHNLFQKDILGRSVLIDSGVDQYRVGVIGSTTYLIDLHSNHDLRSFDGTTWRLTDTNVKSFSVGRWAGKNYLVDLTFPTTPASLGGTLKTTFDTGWVIQDRNVQKMALGRWAGNDYLIDLNTAGALKTSAGSGWTVQDTNVRDFALGRWAGRDYLVDLNAAGTLKTSFGAGWTAQDTGVSSFTLTTDGYDAGLLTDSAIVTGPRVRVGVSTGGGWNYSFYPWGTK